MQVCLGSAADSIDVIATHLEGLDVKRLSDIAKELRNQVNMLYDKIQ